MWLKKLQESYALMELEPQLPSGLKKEWDARYRTMEYTFVTSRGNEVSVEMDHSASEEDDSDHCDVTFKVNDTYNDEERSDKGRDVEILNGVLGVIQDHIWENKITSFTFAAWSGGGDTKNAIMGNEEKLREEAIELLREFYHKVKAEMESMDFNSRQYISDHDILGDVSRLMNLLGHYSAEMRDDQLHNIEMFRKQLYSIVAPIDDVIDSGLDYPLKVVKDFLQSMVKFKEVNAGRLRNRRSDLYRKMIERFLPGWVITNPNPKQPNMFLIKKGR
jgi:hypothetical protein